MGASVEAVRALLRAHLGPAASAMTLSQAPSLGGEQRFVARDGSGALDIHLYPASEREVARREEAGLTLGGAVGLAPALIFAGEAGPASGQAGFDPGAWLIVAQAPRGEPLGQRPLSDAEIDGWLFLLLTLHHLRPALANQPSSMSADLSGWWARQQPAWETCRAAYGGTATQPLLRALTQLHAITQVRIETNRELWAGVERRPCHGDPIPAHLVKDDARLTLIEWSGFGLGDPAIEAARVAALVALTEQITSAQYTRFIAAYLDGMRDLRDATLGERLRLFASVAPTGFALATLAALAQPGAIPPRARRGPLAQVARALIWSQEALGLQFDPPAALLAPLG